MDIIVTSTVMSSPKNAHANNSSHHTMVNSGLTRLFLKLPGCEIDLDVRVFDSMAVDFEFEKVSF